MAWTPRDHEYLDHVRSRKLLFRKHAPLHDLDRKAVAHARHRMRGAPEDIFEHVAIVDTLKDLLRRKMFGDQDRAKVARYLHEQEAHLLVAHDAFELFEADTPLARLVHDKLKARY